MNLPTPLRAYLTRRYATLYRQSVDPNTRWKQTEATFGLRELEAQMLYLGYEFVGRDRARDGEPETWILRRIPSASSHAPDVGKDDPHG